MHLEAPMSAKSYILDWTEEDIERAECFFPAGHGGRDRARAGGGQSDIMSRVISTPSALANVKVLVNVQGLVDVQVLVNGQVVANVQVPASDRSAALDSGVREVYCCTVCRPQFATRSADVDAATDEDVKWARFFLCAAVYMQVHELIGVAHYIQRALPYPFLLRTGGKPTPASVVVDRRLSLRIRLVGKPARRGGELLAARLFRMVGIWSVAAWDLRRPFHLSHQRIGLPLGANDDLSARVDVLNPGRKDVHPSIWSHGVQFPVGPCRQFIQLAGYALSARKGECCPDSRRSARGNCVEGADRTLRWCVADPLSRRNRRVYKREQYSAAWSGNSRSYEGEKSVPISETGADLSAKGLGWAVRPRVLH
ncbi:MAG: hypothetical protein IPK80_27590 [Nannocystis sp.]|nr:hypothetical protein [Nannocystis sp.]